MTTLYTIRGPSGRVIRRHYSLWETLDTLLALVNRFPNQTFTFS